MNEQIKTPVYRKIAVDVAGRIYHGEYHEGDKIKGRSILAGEYNTSPETIRRAMNLLKDMDVVCISQGSGIIIKSKENAYKFIEMFQNKETIDSLRKELSQLLADKKKLEERINTIHEKIIEYSNRFKNTNIIQPMEIQIPQYSPVIGKSVFEVNFWHNTGATIIGFKRNGYLILSPGPYEHFEADDIILTIGNPESFEYVRRFISGK